MIGIGALVLACPLCMVSLESTSTAAPKAARQTAKPQQPETDEPVSPDDDGIDKLATVRLNYIDASWTKVLKDFAEATETELVADRVPTKKYSRWDLKRHKPADALKILNQSLEPENYRLQVKGRYLILNNLKDLRHDYPAAILRGDSREEARDEGRPDSGVKTASAEAEKVVRLKPVPRDPAVKQAAGEVSERSVKSREAAQQAQSEPVETTVRLKSRDAFSVTKIMYKAFKPQAEEVDDGDGPQGLRGFLVRRQAARIDAAESSDLPVQFSIGMDRNKNQLVVQASPQETKSIVKFIKTLDTAPKDPQTAVRAVKTTKDAGKVAATLQPQLNKISTETRKLAMQQGRPVREDGDEQEADLNAEEAAPEPAQPRAGARRNAARGQPAEAGNGAAGKGNTPQALLGSLKGEVRVESVPELGILVVTGNQSDVEAVMEVIAEIERLSKGTAPEVRTALLYHVSSEALAALLTTVYERLGSTRNSAVQQSQAISVFPVARPNAILVVASKSDMESVFSLIEELDQPSDPAIEFMVYRLKYAVPSQIVDKVEAMYPPQTQTAPAAPGAGTIGLIPRVRIIDDLRTNSVIVQARPRDLREVVKMIEDLDKKDSDVDQTIKIFPLNYAVADEVAFTLSSTLQNVLGAARATAAPAAGGQPGGAGQFGGNQAAGGGASQGAAELREVKSAILTYLAVDDAQVRELRSGILSDIRMTADLRTNSIVVTASPESMEFVAALIKRLDKPSAMTAEIKVFKLKNADATSVQALLERLFGIQRAGQQGAQGGQQGGGQGQLPGLLMADSEDSSSMLIPLRFSVDARTNSVIAIGGGGALTVVEAVVLQLDATDIPQRKNEIYRLKMNAAASVATAISQFLQTQQQALTAQPDLLSPFEQIEREVIVVAEPVSNSLLISATPRFFQDIKDLIIKLDRTPQQVLIQGLIVEVQLTNTDEFGMELGLQDSILFRRSSIPAPVTVSTVSQNATGAQLQTQNIISESANPGYLFNGAATQLGNNTFSGASNPSNVAGQALTGFNTGLSNSSLGYGGMVLQAGSENINFLLRAIAARVRVDVLSRPQIRALDNQPSQIQVGQEVPRINGFNATATGAITPVVQQRAIGIILMVTPRISPDGLVIMTVQARKDSLSPQTISLGVAAGGTAITSPIVNTTNAQSTIAVNSGQTVIMGGMITKQDNVEERKVPILGDIPILGRAFRYDYKQMSRTELLIFLTPRIIKNDEEAEMFKQIEMERMNFIESEAERMHGPLYGMSDYCPPPTDGSSPAPTPDSSTGSSTGPSMEPRSRGTQPVPAPPDARIPGSASKRQHREPHPIPAVDDDEDLEKGFIQTGYNVPQDVGTAAGKTKPAKSGAKPTKEPAMTDRGAEKSTTKSPATPLKNSKPIAKSPAKQKLSRETDKKRAAPERDDS